MNKLLIANHGYDFESQNIEELTRNFSSLEKSDILYILPNYSLLKETRYRLLEHMNAIPMGNILTFDDIASSFKDTSIKYVTRDEVAVIIQMAVYNILEEKITLFKDVMGTRGFSYEVAELILNLKSAGVDSTNFKNTTVDNEELAEIAEIFYEYENILRDKCLGDESDLYYDAIRNLKTSRDLNFSKIIIYGFIEFRKQELELINTLKNIGIELIVQYPFDMKRVNKKRDSLIYEFDKMDFQIELLDERFSNESQKLAHSGFSTDIEKYKFPVTTIKASTKYYELKRVFQELKEKSNHMEYDDMSIIITDEYEELVKNIAKDEGVPVSIMTEISGKDLPHVKSAINFLELIRWEDRSNLITFLKDKNFNSIPTDDILTLESEIRALEYKGIGHNYKDIEDKGKFFLSELYKIRENIFIDPINEITKYIDGLELNRKIFEGYNLHRDINLLKQSIKSTEIINDAIESVRTLSELISMKPEIILELFLEKLYSSSYYENSQVEGIKISKLINSVGIKSKLKVICGLNMNYPKIPKNSYLNSEKFSETYEVFGISTRDKYEYYDNEILKFYQTVANAENLVLTYTYKNVDMKDESSIFLKDILKRIEKNYINELEAPSYINKITDERHSIRDRVVSDLFYGKGEELTLNYLNSYVARELNINIADYLYRFEDPILFDSDKFRGKLYHDENIIDIENMVSSIEYSPSMLNEYISCPYKFYMKYISNLEPKKLEYEDEYYKDRGNFYHSILNNFYKYNPSYLSYSNELLKDKVLKEIQKYLEQLKLDKEEMQVSEHIYLDTIVNLINGEIENRKSINKDFLPWEFEKKYGKSIGKINLKGYIDRIDKSDDGEYIVIDYKSSSMSNITSVKNLKDVQLPMYAYMLSPQKTMGGMYYSIENGKVLIPFISKNLINNKKLVGPMEKDEILKLYQDLEELIIKIDNDIKTGNFLVKPLSRDSCTYCNYRNGCRVEEYSDEI